MANFRKKEGGFFLNPFRFGGSFTPVNMVRGGFLLHFNYDFESDSGPELFNFVYSSVNTSSLAKKFGARGLVGSTGSGALVYSSSIDDIKAEGVAPWTLKFCYTAKDLTEEQVIMDTNNASSNTTGFGIYFDALGILNIYSGPQGLNFGGVDSGSGISLDVPVQMCITWDGTSLRFFYDGVLRKTETGFTNEWGNALLIMNSQAFNQSNANYLDEVLFLKGVCAHTSSYTPESSQFQPYVAPIFSDDVLATSPHAYYRMSDDGSSGYMVDSSGNNHNLLYRNTSDKRTTGLVPSDSDQARYISSPNYVGYIDADPLIGSGSTGWSIMMIAKIGESSGSVLIQAGLRGGGCPEISTEDVGGGQFVIRIMRSGVAVGFYSTGKYFYNIPLLICVTCTSGGLTELWVNGIKDSTSATVSFSYGNYFTVGAGRFYDGFGNVIWDYPILGVVDELTIWQRPLTNPEISAIAATWAGFPTPSFEDLILAENPLAYYRLNETSGFTMVDSSGNSNDGDYLASNNRTSQGLSVYNSNLGRNINADANGVARKIGLSLTNSNGWTFQAIVKATAGDGGIWCVSSTTSGQFIPFLSNTLESGKSRFKFQAAFSGISIPSDNLYPFGTTQILHCVYNPVTDEASLWINGVKQSTSQFSIGFWQGTAQYIGYLTWTGLAAYDYPFPGVIDEVAFFDKDLSQSSIEAIASAAGMYTPFIPKYAELGNTAANGTLSNSDHTVTFSGSGLSKSNIGVRSGKWWVEVTAVSVTQHMVIGVCDLVTVVGNYTGFESTSYGYYGFNGNVINNGSQSALGSAYSPGDVINMLIDADAKTVQFYLNGSAQGSPISTPLSAIYVSVGAGAGGVVTTINFGATSFTYSPPPGVNSGFYY